MNYEGTVYRPPSEARSLIVQLTIGCAHNRCSFCTMYKDKTFRVRRMEEILADFSEAAAYYGDRIDRIFLADGDALVMKTKDLLTILHEIDTLFPGKPRITSYATARDVLRKTPVELKELKEAGLSMVYMGAESGDPVILEAIHKDVTREEMIEASAKLKEAGIKNSVTLISGLGGRERLSEHARESASLITAMKPEYLGFLTLMLEPGAEIIRDIEEGKLTLLTPDDVVEEMEIFLRHVDSEGTVFRANHASNYVILKGNLNADIPMMLQDLALVKEENDYRSEGFRSL